MKPEQLRVHNILLDTIKLLCKNSLPFNQSLRIEGVIGITTDSSDIFLVHVNETLGTDNSSSIVKQETSHEGSFGMATPVRQSHAVAAPLDEGMPCTTVSDFTHQRAVAQSSKSNDRSLDMPVLRKVEATRSTYGSEGSTTISSTLVTQSYMFGSSNGLQNEGIYYEEDGQDDYGDQQDYKTGEEQEMWSTGYDSQHYNTNHQNTFATPPKFPSCTRTKQRGRGGASMRREGRGRAPKSVNNTPERNPMSSGSEPDQFVITQSTYVCGYPECMKEFTLKQNLLQHQTKAHGREPRKRNASMEGDYNNVGFSSGGEADQFVITKSVYVCGYQDCMKRFTLKQNLLQHQTKVHGREPRKRSTPSKAAHLSVFNEEYGAGMMEGDYGNEGVNGNSYGYDQYE